MMTWLLAVAAAAVALWPTGKRDKAPLYLPSAAEIDPPRRNTSYLDAVACLQKVRSRLVHTDLLDDSAAEALSTLTLALQHGSDFDE